LIRRSNLPAKSSEQLNRSVHSWRKVKHWSCQNNAESVIAALQTSEARLDLWRDTSAVSQQNQNPLEFGGNFAVLYSTRHLSELNENSHNEKRGFGYWWIQLAKRFSAWILMGSARSATQHARELVYDSVGELIHNRFIL